jgi:Kdo2-lipid IVA lauroyltransferase/acyltransferase
VLNRGRSSPRNLIEFVPAWLLLTSLALLPRSLAILSGRVIARLVFHLHRRLRRVGEQNLALAMPQLDSIQRAMIIRRAFDSMGRLLGEFSQFPKLTADRIRDVVVYEGLENYERAAARGRGVLMLTGHFGSWELCAFAQGVYGHPLSFLVRPLDNALLDRLITRYRRFSGNLTIDKNRAVRPVLEALKQGRDVGLLIDVNMVREEGVFCDFFGIPACSTTGLAVFALRSGSPVVPGFLFWDEQIGKHRLLFRPEVPIIRTGDFKEDVRINTAEFTRIIEEQVRERPDQWLWVHKRWQTRPEGEPDLYGSVNADRPTRAMKMRFES